MYKVAVYNEYHIRNLLLKDTIDFNKFYKEQLIDFLEVSRKDTEKYKKEAENLNSIINELEKCLQNYIYAIEPIGCSINYNCEYDSEEDYINAMKEQSKLKTFKFLLNKLQELKGSDKE